VTRTYAYGLHRIDESQQISGTWVPNFYGYDGHGNVRFLTNTAAAVTDSYDHDAFGMPISTSGTTANNYLYSGERYDSSIGVYDLRARYYNQSTGRLWARDPEEGVTCTPLSINPYIYGLDDPVDQTDPTGRATTLLPPVEPPPVEPPPIEPPPQSQVRFGGIEYLLVVGIVSFGTIAGSEYLAEQINCKFLWEGTGTTAAVASNAAPVSAGPCLQKPKPRNCSNTYPKMLICENLPQGYKFGSFGDARDAVAAYLGRTVDKAKNQPKQSTKGPCVGLGTHYSLRYTDGGPGGYPASIGCCPCCSDRSGSPDPTQTRCKVLNVDNHKVPPSPPF
jgi:RHS repeat-associated protein